MSDLNSVHISGRLVEDPVLSESKDGSPKLSFIIANDGIPDRDGQKRTSFFRLTLWKQMAQSYKDVLKKGSFVVVSGSITQNRWTDPQTQQKKSMLAIYAAKIDLPPGTWSAKKNETPQDLKQETEIPQEEQDWQVPEENE